MHLESKHNAAEYSCDQCDTKTRTRRMLKFHKEKVHDGMRYFCELCSHQATNSYNLKTHKRRCHDKIEINCSFCQFKDFEKSRVSLHERKKHSMEAKEVWFKRYLSHCVVFCCHHALCYHCVVCFSSSVGMTTADVTNLKAYKILLPTPQENMSYQLPDAWYYEANTAIPYI